MLCSDELFSLSARPAKPAVGPWLIKEHGEHH